MPVSEIDYLICNHTEPDHSGSVKKILELNPDIEVVGSIAAIRNLKEITNMTFKEHIAKDGAELDLGDGKVLKFCIVPNLHWPDTMVTYLESEKTLFSCDVFGAHYCEDAVVDEDIIYYDKYEKAMKVYYDCLYRHLILLLSRHLKSCRHLTLKWFVTVTDLYLKNI